MSPPTFVLLDRLDQLLAPPRSVESDFSTLLQALHDRKYTGPITLHFHNGEAKIAQFDAPQIKLTP
jgi:sugar phosphate isomerase/epimerase